MSSATFGALLSAEWSVSSAKVVLFLHLRKTLSRANLERYK